LSLSTIKKPHILFCGGFLKNNKKSRGFAGPAALRFYVSPSQKPSGGPPEYKYYHYGYDQDVAAQIVMGHIMAFLENLVNTIYKNSSLSRIF
jgi:hypothetical protein